MKPLRVLLAEEHLLFREAVQAELARQREAFIVFTVKDGVEAINRAKALKPDVILMNTKMQELDTIESVRLLKKALPHVKIIMLSNSIERELILAFISAGASGYFFKETPFQTIMDALRETNKNTAFFDPFTAFILAGAVTAPKTPESGNNHHGLHSLSDREKEVVALIAKGYNNNKISEKLFISENTVKTHINHILKKLHLTDRLQITLFFLNLASAESN